MYSGSNPVISGHLARDIGVYVYVLYDLGSSQIMAHTRCTKNHIKLSPDTEVHPITHGHVFTGINT